MEHASKAHRPSACSKLYGVPTPLFLFGIKWWWIRDSSEVGGRGGGGESGEAASGGGDRKSRGGGGGGEETERIKTWYEEQESGWWTLMIFLFLKIRLVIINVKELMLLATPLSLMTKYKFRVTHNKG